MNAPWMRWCAYLVIAAATLWIYRPAVYHTVRADQWFFLGYATQEEGWWSLLGNSVSFSRIAELHPGDTELFRPLLFVLMCSELRLFGYNFAWWQLVSIMLHLAAVFWLLKLLWAMHPGGAAAILTLLFASLHIDQPAVIWHHDGGYLLYVVFALVALYHVYCHASEGQRHPWRLWLGAAALTAACFTYEAGTALCILCAGYLWWMRGRSSHAALHRAWPLLVLAPVVLYGAVSYIDFKFIHPVPAVTVPNILKAFGPVRTAWGIIAVSLVYIYAALFPLLQSLDQTESVYLLPLSWSIDRSFMLDKPMVVLALSAAPVGFIGLTAMLCAVRWRRVPRSNVQGARLAGGFALLCCGAWCAPITLIVVGRALSGSVMEPLKRNAYYSYLIVPFMIITAFSVCRAIGFDHLRRMLWKAWRLLLVAAMLVLVVCNGWRVYATNVQIREHYPSGNTLLAPVDNAGLRPRFEWEYFMQRGLYSFWGLHDPTAAVVFISRAIEIIPTNAASYLCRGAVYENMICSTDATGAVFINPHYYTNALTDFTTAFRLDPTSSEISNRLAALRGWFSDDPGESQEGNGR